MLPVPLVAGAVQWWINPTQRARVPRLVFMLYGWMLGTLLVYGAFGYALHWPHGLPPMAVTQWIMVVCSLLLFALAIVISVRQGITLMACAFAALAIAF